MSWVSQANLKSIMSAIRNKFTTGDLVIANDAKDTGVELNHTAQDGLVTVSPISTDASVESALHLSNGDDSKKTELTQGTLSYVTGTGDSEAYNYMSLLGDGVTFGKKGGGNVQVGGVADPTDAQQVATKNYADNVIKTYTQTLTLSSQIEAPAGSITLITEGTLPYNPTNIRSICMMLGNSSIGITNDGYFAVYSAVGKTYTRYAIYCFNFTSETVVAVKGMSFWLKIMTK